MVDVVEDAAVVKDWSEWAARAAERRKAAAEADKLVLRADQRGYVKREVADGDR